MATVMIIVMAAFKTFTVYYLYRLLPLPFIILTVYYIPFRCRHFYGFRKVKI